MIRDQRGLGSADPWGVGRTACQCLTGALEEAHTSAATERSVCVEGRSGVLVHFCVR